MQEGKKEAAKGGHPNNGMHREGGNDWDEFLNIADTMLIFSDPKAYEDRRHQKLTHQEIYATALATPIYLHWSEWPITFDRSDHPDRVMEAH